MYYKSAYVISELLQIPVEHLADIGGVGLRLPTAHELADDNALGVGEGVQVAAILGVRHVACEEVVEIGLVEPVDGEGGEGLRGKDILGHGQQGDADVAAVADVEVEVEVEARGTVFHLQIYGLWLWEPHLLVAGGHQLWHYRQTVGHEVCRLQPLGVEVEDVPLAGAGGYQRSVVGAHDAEIAVDAQRCQLADPQLHGEVLRPEGDGGLHVHLHFCDDPHAALLDDVEGGKAVYGHQACEAVLEVHQQRVGCQTIQRRDVRRRRGVGVLEFSLFYHSL